MSRKAALLSCLVSLIFSNLVFANNSKDHHHDMHHMMKSDKSKPSVKVSIVKMDDRDDKKLVQIKLNKIKDDSPVTPDSLKEVHTQKAHLLIIDDSLTDYSHIHPKPTNDAGVYEFEWNPIKNDAHYRMWADLFPLDTNAQEYAIGDLTTTQGLKGEIDKTISMQSSLDGMTFKLAFNNSELQAGKSTMGTITITDSKGNPIKDLEPIMGAFAHIVGFNEDFQTVVHIHPMGTEPTKDTDRGGPELQFHIMPEKAGFIKLFAQVKINSKELFAPFGIMIKDSK